MASGTGLVTLSPLPFMFADVYLPQSRARRESQHSNCNRAHQWILQEHISGNVGGANWERKSRAQFAELNRIHMEAYKDAIDAFSYFYPEAVELLSMSGVALYWVGVYQRDCGNFYAGVLISFIQYAQRFFRPIQDLSEKFNILQAAMAASERIFGLLDEPVTIVSPAKVHTLAAPRGEIEFRNVWFGLSRRSDAEGRGLGASRCLLPCGAGTDAGDRWAHRARAR